MQKTAIVIVIALFFVSGCGGGGGGGSASSSASSYDSSMTDSTLLLVIAEEISTQIAPELDEYCQSIEDRGMSCREIVWASGTAMELREVIKSYHAQQSIAAVLMLGELPAAWYEQEAEFGSAGSFHEEFPCDIYYMSLDSQWSDQDQDGIFDGHSQLRVDLPVSRVKGEALEIAQYLQRVLDYREGGSLVSQRAFIFKDDDWRDYRRSYDFHLSSLYSGLEIYETEAETTRDGYDSYMNHVGAEFIYQWVHSSPSTLYFQTNEGNETLTANEIRSRNYRASFFNLYDCSAARFTGENLASTYLKTDFGLAVIGTSKTGGLYDPFYFHSSLANGESWGAAFATWYNREGRKDDNWFLGMCIQGCPVLRISTKTAQYLSAKTPILPPSKEDMALLQSRAVEDEASTWHEGFRDYKRQNPRFF